MRGMLLRVAAGVAAAAAPLTAASAEELKVAYNQWAGFAPVFVAAEKGFFKEAGVDVTLQAFSGPGDSLAPLIAGHLDVSLTTLDNVVLINSMADASSGGVKAIYLLDASDGADAVVAKKEIADPSGLRGKTIGVTVGEVNHLLLMKALESAKLSEGDVSLVNMSPDDAGAAFVAGNLDAAVTWEPWVSKAVEAGGTKVYTSSDTPNLLLDVVAATGETIGKKRAALSAFLKGVEMGSAYLESNPDEAYAAAGKWLDVSGPEVKEMLGGVKLYRASEQADVLTGKAKASLADSLESVSGFLKAQEKIENEKPVDAMIDASFVTE